MKYISMLVLILCIFGIAGCDAPSMSDDYADLFAKSSVISKKQLSKNNNISLYTLKIKKTPTSSIYYSGDVFLKIRIKLYAPTKFAHVGDVIGMTSNGTYGVIKDK